MRSVNIICFLIALVIFTKGYANQGNATSHLTRFDQKCACKTFPHDPFDSSLAFNFGKFQGECVDSCKYRTVKVLQQPNLNNLEVANLMHFGKFYRGTLNPTNIESVDVGFEQFEPGLFHVLLKFNLHDQAIASTFRLQNSEEGSPIKLKEFVLSPEGVPPGEAKYNLFEAYKDNYLLANRFLSAQELQRRIEENKNSLTFYRLKISGQQAAEIFYKALQTSNEKGIENVYHLFSNNCATNSFSYLDKVLGPLLKKNDSFQRLQVGLPIWGPLGTLKLMYSLNLIENQKSL